MLSKVFLNITCEHKMEMQNAPVFYLTELLLYDAIL